MLMNDQRLQRLNDLNGFLRVAEERLNLIESECVHGKPKREAWPEVNLLIRTMRDADLEREHLRFQMEGATRDGPGEMSAIWWRDILMLEGLRTKPHESFYRLLDQQFYEKYRE